MGIIRGLIFIVKIILLAAGTLIAYHSICAKKLPKGILEWGIWIADIAIIISGFIQGGVNG